MLGAIRCDPSDFECRAVVEWAGDRAAHGRYADNHRPLSDSDCGLEALRRRMVPMPVGDKSECLVPTDRDDAEAAIHPDHRA